MPLFTNNNAQKTAILDRISVVFSGLCLLHCLALPVLVLIVPLGGGLLRSDAHFHSVMLSIIVPVSALALWAGFRHHHNSAIVAGGLIGVSLLVIAATLAHAHLSPAFDTGLTVMGSIVLALTHFFNMRFSRHRDPHFEKPCRC